VVLLLGRWDEKTTEGMKRDEEAGNPPQRCSGEHGGRTESCSGWEEEGILCNLEISKKGDTKKWWDMVLCPKEGYEGMETLPRQIWET